jgi:hypothetical protein
MVYFWACAMVRCLWYDCSGGQYMFFTLAFDIKSLTVASGTFVAAMILMIAHWNWMDQRLQTYNQF